MAEGSIQQDSVGGIQCKIVPEERKDFLSFFVAFDFHVEWLMRLSVG